MRRSAGLRRQILSGYMVLVVITGVVGTWAIYNFVHLARVITEITRENYISVLAAENMVAAIERQDSAELLMLLGEVRGAGDIYQIGHSDFLKWSATEETNITLPGEGRVFNEVKARYKEYGSLFEAMHGLVVGGDSAGARRVYLAQAEPMFKAIRGSLQELLEMNHQALMEGNSRSRAAARWATVSTVAVGVSAVLIGVFLGAGVSASVVRPTLDLTRAVRRIKEGNLDEAVEVQSTDEIGELAQEFNNMVARLREYEEAMSGRVAAEQRKALTVITAMDEAVVLIDGDRRILMMNPSAEAFLGLRRDEAVGRDAFEAIARTDVAGMIGRALADGVAPHPRTVSAMQGDEQRFYEAEVVPLASVALHTSVGSERAGERPSGAVVVFKDVTYFARLEKMKSDFLSDVSHEIRTPLTSIAMGVGMLRESTAMSGLTRERALIDMAEEETARLTGLVDDLLELSKLESGRVNLKLQDVEFQMILDRALSPFGPQTADRGVALEVEAVEALPVARVDPDKVISVIANLLSNALRYTAPGGRIALRASRRGDEIAVSVSDTGPGIPVHQREKIFDRFYQMKERPGGAAGLGLPISKAIVKAHGGEIWVEGEPGHGATFVFTLPIAGPPTSPSTTAATVAAVAPTVLAEKQASAD
ncbi:MAG: ATP-binding protein [Clostridia bacterium]|nr:ATP-binding protein [Clostridia bacterium]